MSGSFSPRKLLLPLVPVYRLGLWLRVKTAPVKRLRLPVVSIGNLSTGGSGKTPLTIALAKALTARGVYVDVLSRGYGRTSSTAARVPVQGAALEFGDEPLLITEKADIAVYVAPDRYQAGLLAEGDSDAVAGGWWQDAFLYARAYTIAGGANEVLRNVVAERALGLPRDRR